MEYNTNGLNLLSKQLNDFVVKVGFDEADIPLRLALIHSEISETLEAYRNDKYADIDNPDYIVDSKTIRQDIDEAININDDIKFKQLFENDVKDTVEDEIADSIIRLLDLCGKLNIDIEWHIKNKAKYNSLRGYKYGGKKF